MQATLFTTTTCPKCPAFKQYISEHVPFGVRVIDEREPDFGELAGKYGVTAAPTLIVENDEGGELLRTSEASDVEQALKSGMLG